MLTNKKVLVRVIAFALVLVMTSAIFLGCKNDQTQADIEAAQQAAADAQKAAEDAAKLAEDLKAQLDATKKELEELQNKPADKDDSIKDPEFDGITNKFVTEKVLAKFSALKAEYLTVRQDWYTTENYKKVAEIFEEAGAQIYRATSAEGVEAIINNAKTAADAVDNVVSDAAKVQALIAAFGDVDTALTLAAEDKVEAAEEALEDWAAKYAPTLLPTADPKNLTDAEIDKLLAIAENKTEGKAYINVEDDNGLDEANKKLDMLEAAADEVSDVIEEVKEDVVDPAVWNNIAENAKDIEAAYELYKRFYTLNGGDDSAILGAEEFIKEYVLVLFDRQFSIYQGVASDFLDDVLEFFLDPTKEAYTNGAVFADEYKEALEIFTSYIFSYVDGAKLINNKAIAVDLTAQTITVDGEDIAISINAQNFKRDFKRIVAKEMANINALDFAKDYKGVKSLADALKDVDQFVIKAVIEMSNFYYTEAILPVIEEMIDAKIAYLDEKLEAIETAVTGAGTAAANVFYADAFEALSKDLAADWKEVAKKAADVEALTYDKLNTRATDAKKYNISQTELFNLDAMKDENGIFTGKAVLSTKSGNAAAMNMIFDEIAAVVEKAFLAVYTADIKFVDELSFFDFKMGIAQELDELANFDGVVNKDEDVAGLFLLKTDIPAFKVVNKNNDNKKDSGDKFADGVNTWTESGKYAAADKPVNDEQAYYTLIGAVAHFAGDDDIKRNDLFNAIGDAAYDTRSAIMALDLDSYAKSEYQAVKASDGKKLYITGQSSQSDMLDEKLTTTSTDKKAVKIVLDQLTVAKNDVVAKYEAVANTMLGKVLDACRSNIKSELAAATDLYKTNYFGEQDKVLLQKDMDAYIAYLTELSDVADNAEYNAFSATNVSKEKFGTGKVSAELSGYFAVEPSDKNWQFHIRGLESNSAASNVATYETYGVLFAGSDTITVKEKYIGTQANYATGADVSEEYATTFRSNATDGEIAAYFNLNKASALEALADVKELAYYKDDVLNSDVDHDPDSTEDDSLNIIYNKYVGEYDTEKKVWTKAPVNAYDFGTLRSELYLANLAKVKAAIAEKVNAINLADDDYENFEDAKAAIKAIMEQAVDAEPSYKASEDDFSLEIVYDRYYEVNGYEWTKYDADK